jgi:hypothetical protein
MVPRSNEFDCEGSSNELEGNRDVCAAANFLNRPLLSVALVALAMKPMSAAAAVDTDSVVSLPSL